MAAPVRPLIVSPLVLGLSIAQVVIAIPCICLQVVLMAKQSPLNAIGTGIWSGIFSAFTGSVGILYSYRKTQTLAVAFLSLTVLSNLSILALVIISTKEWTSVFRQDGGLQQDFVLLGLNMMLLGVGQAGVTIVSTACTCYSLCSRNNRRRSSVIMPGQVYYFTDVKGRQQAMVVPYRHQGAAEEQPQAVVVPYSHQGAPGVNMGAGPPVIMSAGVDIGAGPPVIIQAGPLNDEDSNLDETDMRSIRGFQTIKRQYQCNCGRRGYRPVIHVPK